MTALKKWKLETKNGTTFLSFNSSQMLSKVAVPKILETFLEKTMVILVSVTAYRPSYFQTMNSTACFPRNFEAAIFPNIFIWLFHLSCITSSYFLNSYQIINRGCLVYMFSLLFSWNKFFLKLLWKFRVRRTFSCQ